MAVPSAIGQKAAQLKAAMVGLIMTCQDDLLEFREAMEKIEKDRSQKQRIREKPHKENSEANPKYP